jgi:hypothetical protein
LEAVRGIQLSNAMKNMDVGELRPRQVIDEEDDQVQVLSNSNVQEDTNQASTSGFHDNVEDQVASSSSQVNQSNEQAIKYQYSNQPILQEIIHLTLYLEISLEVYRQDHDWHYFVSISHLYHLLNQRRQKKH